MQQATPHASNSNTKLRSKRRASKISDKKLRHTCLSETSQNPLKSSLETEVLSNHRGLVSPRQRLSKRIKLCELRIATGLGGIPCLLDTRGRLSHTGHRERAIRRITKFLSPPRRAIASYSIIAKDIAPRDKPFKAAGRDVPCPFPVVAEMEGDQ